MGRVQSELKQHEEALVSYRRALSLDPADTWSMNNMALIFILQDRYEEALPALARATQLEPTVAVFQNNLGIALERSGRYALATEAYKAAVAADSGYNKAVMSLARVQGRTDDPSLAPIDLSLLAENFDKQVRTVAVKP
jgi:Flp pilus assembly protein TadD